LAAWLLASLLLLSLLLLALLLACVSCCGLAAAATLAETDRRRGRDRACACIDMVPRQ